MDNEVKGVTGSQYDFGARMYDPRIGKFLSVDAWSSKYPHQSPYAGLDNNPISKIDPTGNGTEDWVQGSNGDVKWDKDANSQATTKAGEKYLGKDLTFKFNSYIDAKPWDGPMGSFAAGDKLTSTIKLTSHEDAQGNLTSVDIKSDYFTHKTGGILQGKSYFPGQSNVKLDIKGATNGSATFEQHSSVHWFDGMGLKLMGYQTVNVAQQLTLGLSGTKLSVTASTDVFPSASLSVNGIQLFNYAQPSFKATHGNSGGGYDNGIGGVAPKEIANRPTPSFYQRYKK